MIQIGKFNRLPIVKFREFGAFVSGEPFGEILVPRRFVQPEWRVGDEVELFVYTDSEDRLVATTENPLIQAGGFAVLRVSQCTQVGAFLSCGLSKELLVPFREQHHRLQVGEKVVAYAFVDPKSQRLVATTKIEPFLQTPAAGTYKPKDRVRAIVYQYSELGYKVIVDQQYKGMLFADEVFEEIRYGDKLELFVDQLRPDGKLDLVLYKTGYNKVLDFSVQLWEHLKSSQGFLPFTDRTDPERIYRVFGVSKKTFKKAVGDLYRQHLIVLEEEGIRMAKRTRE